MSTGIKLEMAHTKRRELDTIMIEPPHSRTQELATPAGPPTGEASSLKYYMILYNNL